jgi:hypothetical protein
MAAQHAFLKDAFSTLFSINPYNPEKIEITGAVIFK